MSIFNFIITALSLLSVSIISASLFFDVDYQLYLLLEYFDFLLCLVFFYDFILQLSKEKNKWKYLYTYGWIDIMSFIPLINEFRFARLLRIFRIIRIVKSYNLFINFLKMNKRQTLYGTVVVLLVFSVFTSSFFVLYFEQNTGNIATADDAIWWTFITITTVGYGDYYPVTREGKLISSFLIINGLVGFGALVSYLNNALNKLDK